MSEGVREQFFRELKLRMVGTGLVTRKPATATGMDIYIVPGNRIKVTANIAPSQNRVSTKLTVDRGTRGAPTRAFDTLRAKYESLSELDGTSTEWDAQPRMVESRAETCWELGDQDETNLRAHCERVVKNALVLKGYAKEVARLR